jgi:transposase
MALNIASKAIATIRSASILSQRAHNQRERLFNQIEQCRPVATHYDKLAITGLASVQLASIRLWLRVKSVRVPRNTTRGRVRQVL